MALPALTARLAIVLQSRGVKAALGTINKGMKTAKRGADRLNGALDFTERALGRVTKAAAAAGLALTGLFATAWKSPQLQAALANLQNKFFQFGEIVAPILNDLVDWVAEIMDKYIIPMAQKHVPKLREAFEKISPVVDAIVDSLFTIFDKVMDIVYALIDLADEVGVWDTMAVAIGVATDAVSAFYDFVLKAINKYRELRGLQEKPASDPKKVAADVEKMKEEGVTVDTSGSRSKRDSNKSSRERYEEIKSKTVPSSATNSGGGGIISKAIDTIKNVAGKVGGFFKGLFGKNDGGLIDKTGPYLLHAGERVVPRSQNAMGGGPVTVNIQTGPVSSGVDLRNLATLISQEISKQNRYARSV